MIYEFEAKDGERIELMMPSGKAPKVGADIEHEGKVFKRIASATSSPAKVWRPYVSSRLPRNMPGCECTPEGKPIINTQATERSVGARLGWERE